MKLSALTRLTSMLLVAGFFYSCSTSKSSVDELINANKYQQALVQVDKGLAKNPNQPELHIKKGEINALLARTKTPAERNLFYNKVHTAFASATALSQTNAQKNTIDSLTFSYWSLEHNSGLKEYASSKNSTISATHFKNAIIINPEEMSSYQALSTLQYEQGNIDAAIQTLTSGIDNSETVSPEFYESLGFLYLQNGDSESAINYYELANQEITTNENITFGLVNAYISVGDTEKALELLPTLVENHPKNPVLRNVYGVELYKLSVNVMNDLIHAYQQNDIEQTAHYKLEAEAISEQAEDELIEAYKLDSENYEFIESLAVFYNNMTAKYFEAADVAFPQDTSVLEQKALTLLDFAITYYGDLAKLDSHNDDLSKTVARLNALKENRSKK